MPERDVAEVSGRHDASLESDRPQARLEVE